MTLLVSELLYKQVVCSNNFESSQTLIFVKCTFSHVVRDPNIPAVCSDEVCSVTSASHTQTKAHFRKKIIQRSAG